MRILVVGAGAREHALVWKLARSEQTARLWCTPGNAGTAELAESVPVRPADLDGVVAAAERLRVDLVVVGPEGPLVAGLADRLAAAGLRVFGPTRDAARIEGSKAWAKQIMAACGVPTARSTVVTDLLGALAALADFALPVVVKADGLTGGTGVVVAESRDEARAVLTAFLEDDVLGAAGRTVLLEEHLPGREVSVVGLSDGATVVAWPPVATLKRVFDGDRGPNTGGLGAYVPGPDFEPDLADRIRDAVLVPIVRALAGRGTPLRGTIGVDLVLTGDGPKVLEVNARFGDPAAQALLPLVDDDLPALLAAVADGRMADRPAPRSRTDAAVAVVLVAAGYPGPHPTGVPIVGLERVPDDVLVFHAGTRRDADGRLVTAGGRVLTVVGRGPTLAAARERAYAAASVVTFAGRHLRRDVAAAGDDDGEEGSDG